jgi:hypothetical protein
MKTEAKEESFTLEKRRGGGFYTKFVEIEEDSFIAPNYDADKIGRILKSLQYGDKLEIKVIRKKETER